MATASAAPCTRSLTFRTRAGRGTASRSALALALEPWFARTTDRIVYDAGGRTIRSADGSHTAHSEHTVAITEDAPLVLTRREPENPATRSEFTSHGSARPYR